MFSKTPQTARHWATHEDTSGFKVLKCNTSFSDVMKHLTEINVLKHKYVIIDVQTLVLTQLLTTGGARTNTKGKILVALSQTAFLVLGNHLTNKQRN